MVHLLASTKFFLKPFSLKSAKFTPAKIIYHTILHVFWKMRLMLDWKDYWIYCCLMLFSTILFCSHANQTVLKCFSPAGGFTRNEQNSIGHVIIFCKLSHLWLVNFACHPSWPCVYIVNSVCHSQILFYDLFTMLAIGIIFIQ